jgi:hypothetical protein
MAMCDELQKEQEIVFLVGWQNEDELPDYIDDNLYKHLYNMSKLDGVRLFPFIKIDGKKHFLGDLGV